MVLLSNFEPRQPSAPEPSETASEVVLPLDTDTSPPPTLAATDPVPTATIMPSATSTSVPPTFTPVPPTRTPQPVGVTNSYNVSQRCNSVGQRGDIIDYVITINTVNLLRIEFQMTDPNSCSDALLHILLDGDEIFTTSAVGPLVNRDTTGLLDLSSAITEKGKYQLTIRPEGIVGGCNTGTLGGWGGTLIVQTNKYP